ncbi:MAG: Bug family tripartite tricarboxylate transporter substrate binding protein [Xanthobacteraceae bacterium]
MKTSGQWIARLCSILGLGFWLAACAIGLPRSAQAQAQYPNRSVRIIVPFGPGGVADITVRVVAEKLGDKLGQRFVVENNPGAGGIAAARAALSGGTDGYTLALLTNGTAISVPLFKSLPFDPLKDFVPISSLGQFDFVIAVNAPSSLRTLEDFLRAAREKPGVLNVGTVNVGSSQNLGAELFRTSAHIEFAIVPYRTTPEVLVALLRDDIQLTVDSYAGLKAALSDQRIRVIASTGRSRSQILPDVPTALELGIKGFEVEAWNGLFAPVGTPPNIVTMLNRALREVLADPETKQRMLELGIEAKASSPEELRVRLQADIEKWAGVIARAGIPKQ